MTLIWSIYIGLNLCVILCILIGIGKKINRVNEMIKIQIGINEKIIEFIKIINERKKL